MGEWSVSYNYDDAGVSEEQEDAEGEDDEGNDEGNDEDNDDEDENVEDHQEGGVSEGTETPGGNVVMYKILANLSARFHSYCRQLPVLGFSSAKYDLNLVKSKLDKVLKIHEGKHDFVMKKKASGYMCLSTNKFKFLYIVQYIAPGSSYSKFLKAYQVSEAKSYFPYEWFTHVDKLKCDSLPPYESFYSSIKDLNVLEEEMIEWERGERDKPKPATGESKYRELLQIWMEKGMSTFADFLVYYNNLDTGPMVMAITRFLEYYEDKNLDPFKMAISIPGLARRTLFKVSENNNARFELFGPQDEDLFRTVKQNIVGGPSIIFRRHHKVGETRIRHGEGKICRGILGEDSNALYLFALAQDMPTGSYARLTNEGGVLVPLPRERKFKNMFVWMDYIAHRRGVRIRHKNNSGRECRVGPYFVDGLDAENNHIYEVTYIL